MKQGLWNPGSLIELSELCRKHAIRAGCLHAVLPQPPSYPRGSLGLTVLCSAAQSCVRAVPQILLTLLLGFLETA